jgi:hypothetical protein
MWVLNSLVFLIPAVALMIKMLTPRGLRSRMVTTPSG